MKCIKRVCIGTVDFYEFRYMPSFLQYVKNRYTIKTNAFNKNTCCSVNLEDHIFLNIFIFKTCHLYLDTGCNICLGELSVGHGASISPLSFNIIYAVVTFQHVEKCFQIYRFNEDY